MIKNKILKIVYNAIFIIITLILGFLGKFAMVPMFPFLKLDFSDIPVFLITLISGIPSGVTVLLISSALRTLMFSTAGWLGFIVRSTSIMMIIFIGLTNRINCNKIYKTLIITIGIILCTAIKIILNYFMWTNFYGITPEAVNALLVSIIIPYNSLKLIVSTVLAFLLIKPIKKVIFVN